MVLDHQERERMHNCRGKNSDLRKKMKTSGNELIFPDDLLMEIASRLSIQDALKFQLVCKRIRDLIMSRPFINLFKINSSTIAPMLFETTKNSLEQDLQKNFWKSECTKSNIRSSVQLYPEYAMEFSHNGLIVSKNHKIPGEFIIFNPIYGQNVMINVPGVPESEILGVFYQDAMKEYSTLWQITASSRPVNVRYKMLNLGSEPKWKEITNPWTQNGRFQGIRPVSVNEYLYWVVEPEQLFRYKYNNRFSITTIDKVDVLEFNTRTETFEVIPCPVPVSFMLFPVYFGLCDINLFQAKGVLLLVQIDQKGSEVEINIWTLKDRVNKTWTSSESVKVTARFGKISKAVAYWNEEIVIQSYQGLFVCNISLRTSRKITNGRYNFTKRFVSHGMSLASLENCKPEICMVEEDKNRPKNVTKEITRKLRNEGFVRGDEVFV